MKLGEASQISVGVRNLQESIKHYEKLGFSRLNGDTDPYPWAQITDGSLLILLNQDGMEYIGLLYFSSKFSEVVGHLKKAGVRFVHESKKDGMLHQVIFATPDNFFLSVVNADPATLYQPSGPNYFTMPKEDQLNPAKYPNAMLGFFGEFCHKVSDFAVSRTFWESIGFECAYSSEGPYHWGLFRDSWHIIGLHQTTDFHEPAITYFAKDSAEKVAVLKKDGISSISQFTGTGGGNDANVVITSPEGQKVFLFNF